MNRRMTLRGLLHSEIIRLRRSALIPFHLVGALLLGGTAGAYFSNAPWPTLLGTDAFAQFLGAAAPLLAGIACGITADSEREAGEYVNLLGVPSRRLALSAKLIMIQLLCLIAASIAVGVLYLILAVSGREVPSWGACALAVLGIAIGCFSADLICFIVALRFGRNTSIVIGAFGFIIAMSTLGGLANGLVEGKLVGHEGIAVAAAVPAAWSARLATLPIEIDIVKAFSSDPQTLSMLWSALGLVVVVCVLSSILLMAVALMGVNRFEEVRHLAS